MPRSNQRSGGSTRGTSSIRQRPVSFGNPALSTYHGFVYTLQAAAAAEGNNNNGGQPYSVALGRCHRQHDHHHHQQQPPMVVVVEGAQEVRRLVAMVDVPPHQVPEGILNLARSHRPWIDHVRIVIAENETNHDETTTATGLFTGRDDDDAGSSCSSRQEKQDNDTTTATMNANLTLLPSPHASAVETAASILAEEHQRVTATITQKEEQIHDRDHSVGKRDQGRASFATALEHAERTYLVLIELCSEEAADSMVEDLHGQPYTSLDETDTCSVHHVVALQGLGGVSLMSPLFAPTSTTTSVEMLPPPSSNTVAAQQQPFSEDYNCAVCLERMDLDTQPAAAAAAVSSSAVDSTAAPPEQQHQCTSILTTVCNHSFHMDCLLQWQDSPCPVCRYDHSGLNEALSQCHVCGTTENNFVCLICGVVSCGDGGGGGGTAAAVAAGMDRYYPATTTTTAAAAAVAGSAGDGAGTQGVTEYQLDRTTLEAPTASLQLQHHQPHRILSSSSHAQMHYGETLHAYALNTETQHVWDFAGQGYVHRLLQNKEDGKLVEVNDPSNTTSQERSLSPGLTEAQESEVVHRKLEGFASQYYTLLKSQLEQQRILYKGRLEDIRRVYSDTRQQRVDTADLIAALKQERHQLSQRLIGLQTKCRKVKEDVGFIKSLNESLEANREPIRCQVEKAQRDRMDSRNMFEQCLPPLQEKVTRLMLQLEGHSFSTEADFDGSKKPAAR